MLSETQIAPTRIAVYIRWSTEEQGEGTTLEVQREACLTFAAARGWQVPPDLIFIDQGVSGATLDRPELGRLRSLVRAGAVDCVLVYKLDRLSRSVVDMVKLVLDEWEGRCWVKSALEPIDTATQTGRLFFYQLMSFAEWERSVIRERTFAGKLRRAREGRNPGMPAAYGYRLGKSGMPEADPQAAAIVRLIYRLYLAGSGCLTIARRLAELAHPAPAGGQWSSGQVARMLSNPIYRGTLVYGKRRGRGQTQQPHVVLEGAVPAIVSPADYEAVQAAKARRPGPGRRGVGTGRTARSENLLTGLLRCGCSRAMAGRQSTGDRYRYYRCPQPSCSGAPVPQPLLDSLLADALALHTEQLRGRLADLTGAALDRERQFGRESLAALERELARAQRSVHRLNERLLAEEVNPAEYRELRSMAVARVEAIQERMQCRDEQPETATAGARSVYTFPAVWEPLPTPQRKQVLLGLLQGVQATRNRTTGEVACTFTWRLPPTAVRG